MQKSKRHCKIIKNIDIGKIVLRERTGKKFQLRGISSHGINWDVGAPYVNKASFKTLRDDWGVNAVRLAMYTSEYNGYCAGGNKENLKKQVRNGVKYATDLGMYVVIDWHILKDGNPKKQLKEAKSFFDTMSVQYKNQKNVIYEICNEPNGCSWNTIRDYAEQIIKVIRKNDANAVIIVGTPNWSQLGSDRFRVRYVSYFCWSLSNKKESCSLLASKTRKTGNWKTKDLSKAGKYIRSKYRARKKALGKNS